jgi:diadenosine tetraphosphatase ApaH/serine/threonine PP2A family protein phosphatase
MTIFFFINFQKENFAQCIFCWHNGLFYGCWPVTSHWNVFYRQVTAKMCLLGGWRDLSLNCPFCLIAPSVFSKVSL